MLASYNDIRSRIAEEPKWFDENGVPRYDEFHPHLLPDVYAQECVLYEIACQCCDARFLVAESWSPLSSDRPNTKLSDLVPGKRIHYGDPPCWNCTAGCTMNCIDIRTVQFWTRGHRSLEWTRVPELENVSLESDPIDEEAAL